LVIEISSDSIANKAIRIF